MSEDIRTLNKKCFSQIGRKNTRTVVWILLCPTNYCVHQFTVSSKILSTLAFNIHLFNVALPKSYSTCHVALGMLSISSCKPKTNGKLVQFYLSRHSEFYSKMTNRILQCKYTCNLNDMLRKQ